MSDVPASSTLKNPGKEARSQEEPASAIDTVPASGPGQVGKALEGASPHDDLAKAAKEGSISAGEGGRAVDGDGSPSNRTDVEVVIGEIPDAHDISLMRWTARCSLRDHDLLGTFDSEEAARQAKDDHLAAEHSLP